MLFSGCPLRTSVRDGDVRGSAEADAFAAVLRTGGAHHLQHLPGEQEHGEPSDGQGDADAGPQSGVPTDGVPRGNGLRHFDPRVVRWTLASTATRVLITYLRFRSNVILMPALSAWYR